MGYSVTHSLIASQPPLMVFIVCLTAFGCTMIVLAYVIGEQEIPNPDVQMDWNRFFQKMSNLNLCLLQNFTKHSTHGLIPVNPKHESSLNASAARGVVDESKSMSAVLSNVVDSAMHGSHETTLVEIAVTVKFGVSGKLAAESQFHLKGKLRGSLLGFTGKTALTLFNISLSFRSVENTTCNGDKCISVYDVCITMNLPMELLPQTKAPNVCGNTKGPPLQDFVPIAFSDLPISDAKQSSCVELTYSPDPRLTEMLSAHDRSIVNLHLMHTSYFMFVMVMTLVCFALIRGRYRQPKTYYSLPKVPSDP